jgi:chromosome segregation ATPase
MRNRVSLLLSSVRDELSATRAALDRARQRLAGHSSLVEDSRLRMLMAETPLADRDLRLAEDDHRLMSHEVARLEAMLRDLSAQERSLRARLEELEPALGAGR